MNSARRSLAPGRRAEATSYIPRGRINDRFTSLARKGGRLAVHHNQVKFCRYRRTAARLMVFLAVDSQSPRSPRLTACRATMTTVRTHRGRSWRRTLLLVALAHQQQRTFCSVAAFALCYSGVNDPFSAGQRTAFCASPPWSARPAGDGAVTPYSRSIT